MASFWKLLPKPFLVLAPMDDVTDVVFRQVVSETCTPHVFFTEFVSSDGLNSIGRERVMKKLKYTQNQKPIVAQIWGSNPENIYNAAKLISELGFDGVDINMGCPVKDVVKKGSGAGTIGNYDLAKKIIAAAKKGAKGISVSVKTRLGINNVISHEWIPFLLEQKLDALTLHARTAKQLSKGQADWSEIGKAVILRDKICPETMIIGNGDIKDYKTVMQMYDTYHVDGVMIGRGVFSNPWVFEKTQNPTVHTKKEYIDMLVRHMDLFDETWGETKNFAILKKFFKMYINNFKGASLLRQQLMECKNSFEVKQIFNP
ncbi:MAG: tRNA-dihydrouridine synthase [Patescibacteria group bacterium]